jgi:hypothetical protein
VYDYFSLHPWVWPTVAIVVARSVECVAETRSRSNAGTKGLKTGSVRSWTARIRMIRITRCHGVSRPTIIHPCNSRANSDVPHIWYEAAVRCYVSV